LSDLSIVHALSLIWKWGCCGPLARCQWAKL